MPSSTMRLLSRRTVTPPPRPRHRIPLTTWDISFLSADYIQKGLLYAKPPFPTDRLLDHLQASLAQALDAYYPVAGRFVTDQHRDANGHVLGCSVSIDCDGQGVTDLHDGVFLGFAYNHALSDGTALWRFINVWAGIARDSPSPSPAPPPPPLLERWSPDAGPTTPPVVLPYPDLTGLIERLPPPPLCERMLQFSAETLEALKDRARQELLAAGDTAGAAAVTKFQALSSLVWRSVTRARRMPLGQTTFCRAAINNRNAPPPRSFRRSRHRGDLLERGHGWATAAVGRAVAAHTDDAIRARVAAWMANPVLYNLRFFDPNGIMMGSSPRFDMANKSDGKASLYPGREGAGSIAAELVLTSEHMTLLEQDDEFWAAVSSDRPFPPAALAAQPKSDEH
ncbi:putative acetyltransferase [Zea mays]|uniref:Putative acetyltransferase n=1 Tax=Zea mays TaxID=4577 RepID=A0A3L6EB87_MAIZE|nr:putative acetyltransferase [Zea mays]